MIGNRRNDSSTIRATPSASGDPRINRNFSINSSARSDDGTLPGAMSDVGVVIVAFVVGTNAPSLETGALSSRISRGTPNCARNSSEVFPPGVCSYYLVRFDKGLFVRSCATGQLVRPPSLRITKITDASR